MGRELAIPTIENILRRNISIIPAAPRPLRKRRKKRRRPLAKYCRSPGWTLPSRPPAWCCGETVRRLGNEYLFEQAVQKNIAAWRELGIKKIITTCPHCFNTLKNEYPENGGEFTVVHHAAFLAELLKEGKLKPGKSLAKMVTYHDPCYLARYNDLTRPPRAVFQAVPALALREMPRVERHTFCCGAGGGRIWTTPTARKPDYC